MVHILARHGAKWFPIDKPYISDARGSLLKMTPGYTVEFILGKELKTTFQDQWDKRKKSSVLSPFVFPSPTGSGKIINFRRAWNSACREVGLGYGYKRSEKYVQKWQGEFSAGPMFHDFRRTAIRNMIRSGTPEKEKQE